MFSAVMPNSSYSTLAGAEAPKWSIPMATPAEPTYRSHPKVEAASIDTRAVTSAGSTRLPIRRVLALEQFPTRQRDHPGRHALAGKRVRRREGDLHLGPGGHEDDVRPAVRERP